MNAIEVYDIAIGIERRLSNMYHRFSTLFKENYEVHNFWMGIANHEKSHSETLTLSKCYLMWNHPALKRKKATLIEGSDIREIESLLVMLKESERKVRKERISLQEALHIVLNIESSELNHLYNRLVHLSGFKFSQKPEHAYRSVYEHMKVIKSFMDKYYRGNLPAIRIEDYKEVRPAPSVPVWTVRGKIVEIVSEMSYGFIEGEDGQIYMFLPEDVYKGGWVEAEVNKNVEFSVMGLPWGPRANNINFRHQTSDLKNKGLRSEV